MNCIVISPPNFLDDEAVLINALFEKGIKRYHLKKSAATEQDLAEILESVDPKYLSKISLHSHYHLVLAYGVGGIHFSYLHRKELAEDFPQKVDLYQSFGISVSTEIRHKEESFEPANYTLLNRETKAVQGKVIYGKNDQDQRTTSWFQISNSGENIPLISFLK